MLGFFFSLFFSFSTVDTDIRLNAWNLFCCIMPSLYLIINCYQGFEAHLQGGKPSHIEVDTEVHNQRASGFELNIAWSQFD